MARESPKTCRWPTALLDLLLLQGLLASHGLAAEGIAAADEASYDAGAGSEDQLCSAHLGCTGLYLAVQVNGIDCPGLAHFLLRHGELWTSLQTLRDLSFRLPPDTPDPVRLQDLRVLGVQGHYDASGQSLALTAPLELLDLGTAVLNTPRNPRPHASASPGLLLNYDLYATAGVHSNNTLGAYTELRAFNAAGVFSSTGLLRADDAAGRGWRGSNVRLDSSWTMSFPDSLTALKFGDILSSALGWTRATRFGGIQFGSNFALQPYLVTAPLPQFFGTASLPSTLELYIDGVRQYSGNVPAGPFQLNALPSINGAGNAQVVLSNTLGQQTTLNFPLYNDRQLLQQGLASWSAELGAVRENYGIASFDYGHKPAASGTWRYGLSNTLTSEAHGEAAAGLVNGGAGADWLLGRVGLVSVSLAGSHYGGRGGGQYGLGYSWNNRRFSFSVSAIAAAGVYRDVASLYGAPTPKLTAQALAGYNTGYFGSLGASYLQLRYDQVPLDYGSPALPPGAPTPSSLSPTFYSAPSSGRYATAYWNKSFGPRVALNLSCNQDLINRADRSLYLLATLSLEHNITASAGVQRQNGHTDLVANAAQALPTQGGFGWRATVDRQDGYSDGVAELDYQGRYGRLGVGASSYAGVHDGYASATGALVFMGGELFAARQISDGFAVVSTAGVPNVPVNLQNNPVGTTDRHGLLLITPLNAYQDNPVSIDPMNLPADVRLNRVQLSATPADRSGIVVPFGITPIRAAVIILVDTAGQPLPLGSEVRQRGLAAAGPVLVGYDGAAYLDTLQQHNSLEVHTPDGVCSVEFDYSQPTGRHSIAQLGPLTCRKGKTP